MLQISQIISYTYSNNECSIGGSPLFVLKFDFRHNIERFLIVKILAIDRS